MASFHSRLLIALLSLVPVGMTALPASANSFQNASNHNIWHVRHQIEWDIKQLQHDQRDYHGFKARAVSDLQNAHNQLLAAEEYIKGQPLGGFSGAAADASGERDQGQSDRNIWIVRNAIEHQIHELMNDASDYGGHKAAALTSLRNARTDLLRGERFARQHGY